MPRPKSVIETRTTKDGMTRRRYERDGLPRLTTYEVPETVMRSVGFKSVREYMAAWNRAEVLRLRGIEIGKRIADGIKPAAIAHEFGVTEQAVRIRRKKLGLGKHLEAV